MYFLFVCDNNYCGCDESYVGIFDNELDAEDFADEVLYGYYSFAEPDSRFLNVRVDEDDEDYEEALEEAYEEYQENLDVTVIPITEEEFEEYKADGHMIVG